MADRPSLILERQTLNILNFMAPRLGGIKQKKCIIHVSPKMISFVLFPQASEPSMNFDISKMVCRKRLNVKL